MTWASTVFAFIGRNSENMKKLTLAQIMNSVLNDNATIYIMFREYYHDE